MSTPDEGPVDFYGGPFSNFAQSPFEAPDPWGVLTHYPTVEHYFQAWKATTPEDHAAVLSYPDCWNAKGKGRTITLRPDWEEKKYEVMLAGLREKFRIPKYRDALLETGDREIREDSPTDFVWGWRKGGQNLLGKALMQIRDEIRAEDVVPSEAGHILIDVEDQSGRMWQCAICGEDDYSGTLTHKDGCDDLTRQAFILRGEGGLP